MAAADFVSAGRFPFLLVTTLGVAVLALDPAVGFSGAGSYGCVLILALTLLYIAFFLALGLLVSALTQAGLELPPSSCSSPGSSSSSSCPDLGTLVARQAVDVPSVRALSRAPAGSGRGRSYLRVRREGDSPPMSSPSAPRTTPSRRPPGSSSTIMYGSAPEHQPRLACGRIRLRGDRDRRTGIRAEEHTLKKEVIRLGASTARSLHRTRRSGPPDVPLRLQAAHRVLAEGLVERRVAAAAARCSRRRYFSPSSGTTSAEGG